MSSIRKQGKYSEHKLKLELMDFSFDVPQVRGEWDVVRSALSKYKTFFGDCHVPETFAVPSDPEWPREYWGMKLGNIVCRIRNNGVYCERRLELQEMGFSFYCPFPKRYVELV